MKKILFLAAIFASVSSAWWNPYELAAQGIAAGANWATDRAVEVANKFGMASLEGCGEAQVTYKNADGVEQTREVPMRSEGLGKPCKANRDDVRDIDVVKVETPFGTYSQQTMGAVLTD